MQYYCIQLNASLISEQMVHSRLIMYRALYGSDQKAKTLYDWKEP